MGTTRSCDTAQPPGPPNSCTPAMAPSPLAWLLRLAAFFHLCTLLPGQHLGMTKCEIMCDKMTSRIPVALLIRYQLNQESCGKRAIVLETTQHRRFCADPKEKWVQDAMKHLDHQAAALTKNGGKFEKRVDNVTPGITLATRGLSPSALTKPESATLEDLALELTTISQEARGTMGTSQEPPAAVTGSSLSTSEAQDAGLTAKPQSIGSFEAADISTTVWPSPAVYQSGSSSWAEEKATESPSTTAPSPQVSTTSPSTHLHPRWGNGNGEAGPSRGCGLHPIPPPPRGGPGGHPRPLFTYQRQSR